MRRTRATVGLVAVALGAAGVAVALAGTGASSPGRASGAFAWLHPASPPAGWRAARIAGGASLAYPPGWTPIKTDPGSASAALLGSGGAIDAYVNATPRQGTETLGDWSRFRPQHNLHEGDRAVRLVASSTHLPFRSGGRGSCVIDDYATTKATYREIACLVSGAGSSAVVVAATPTGLWARHAATLERAVASFVP